MVSISESEVLLLGLVHERPLHAYDIEKMIDERNMRNWTQIGFSTIYYSLNKLEKHGFITSRKEEVEGKPSRKVYMITDEGRHQLREHVKEYLSQVNRNSPKFDIGLINLNVLDREEAIQCLETHVKGIRDRLVFLDRAKESASGHRPGELLIERTHRALGSEKKWIKKLLKEMSENERTV